MILLLYAVILLEGYIVLSSELLAIRLTVPFVGSGTDTVSIIIAAVLLPLAFGYFSGGRFKLKQTNGRYQSVRKKLAKNIILSSLILLPGLSFLTVELFFISLLDFGISNRILMILLYCLIFIVWPVYLLGQTVPLVSNYFSKEQLAKITGKMLCFSTVGSCLGSLFSTLVLMHYFGVNVAAITIFMLLALLIILLSKPRQYTHIILIAPILVMAIVLNNSAVLRTSHIVSMNSYNTISVVERDDGRHMIMNMNDSSFLGKDGKKHAYVQYVEDHFLAPLADRDEAPKEILVVGSAGFSFGLTDQKNHYTFVDIDGAVKEVAEKYFLKQPLGPNKKFIKEDIRSFLTRNTAKKYDLIFLDAYLGNLTIPEFLVTQEYFLSVKNALGDQGMMVGNFILSPTFNGTFSQNLDNTLRSVFPLLSRVIIDSTKPFDAWSDSELSTVNILYIYKNHTNPSLNTIYTDNKNPVAFDRPLKNPLAGP